MLVKSRHGTVGLPALVSELNIDEWAGPFTVEIPDSTTEQAVAVIDTYGLTTITALLITSNVNVSITYGTAANNEPIALNAGGVHLMSGTSLAALAMSNASGSVATVTYFCAGT
jgi:hypothetical protein